MRNNLLPIGSIVLLKGGERKLMICGRVVCKENDDSIYDYIGCFYPMGITGSDTMFFFNHDGIEEIYFIGFQDKEEMEYRSFLNNLGDLQVVDGQIVPKE